MTIRPASDRSLFISFGEEIALETHLAVARLTRCLEGVRGILNLHPAYTSVLIDFDPRLVAIGDWHEEGGLRATIELLNSPSKFTALFCVNDQTAYGACLALYRKGLSVPGDVSVIGFDDLPSSAYRLPPLTSVRQSIGELGDRSAQAILQLIDGNRPRFAPPPVELVIRESSIGRRVRN